MTHIWKSSNNWSDNERGSSTTVRVIPRALPLQMLMRPWRGVFVVAVVLWLVRRVVGCLVNLVPGQEHEW